MAGPSASSFDSSYDVFLNFRGEDTRNTITAHLYNALDAAGIHTFMDNIELRTGEEIGPELLSAIQRSRISIPIFSEKYASSKWCLNELVKIVDCKKTKNQLVLPIFYHVDPSHVRHQTGTYTEALQKHNHRTPQRIIEEWKEALREVGELKGWDLKNIDNGNEGTLVKLVVAKVSEELRKNSKIVFDDLVDDYDDLVGMGSHVEKMMSLLNIGSKGVKIVGIWGLGGLGKTTIAQVIYDKIYHHFEGFSFLARVRETSQHFTGLINLQNQLVSDILKGETLKITNEIEGIKMMKTRFRTKKVLIILDDVDKKEQLDALVKNRVWFGSGSRIIITTRDEHILVNHEVDEIYRPSEMDANQSLQLFCKHAFKKDQTPKDYQHLSRSIVKITGGLPLALEVIGSSLFRKKKPAWEDTLKLLQEIPNDIVKEKLQISFDGLRDLEKEIFLDIACFFNGMDQNIACFIWQQCNFYPEIGIEVLRQKALVKIGKFNELKMHDQLRDLGKEIIRQENRKVPGDRSRLWSQKETMDVLKNSTGTDKVEGFCIDFRWRLSSSQVRLMCKGFTKMTKLRLLQVDCAEFSADVVLSFSEVTWLRWRGCPSEFTLNKFHPVNLAVLDLSYSLVKPDWMGWNYIKEAKNLKVLNLTGCPYLWCIPELSNHRLEILILENCQYLDRIGESINCLARLTILNMEGCRFLRDLPYEIWQLTSLKNLNLHQCRILDKLPDSIGLLENLETFDASFCYIQDGGVPDSIGWLSSLKILRLGGNSFHRLPETVYSLSSLQTLDLRLCDKLEFLPELPSGLKYLDVLGCRSLKSLPRLSNLRNLEEFWFGDWKNLVKIPTFFGSRNLERLVLDNFQSLTEIEGLEGLDYLKVFRMSNCKSLRRIGKISGLRKLKEVGLTNLPMLSRMEGLEGLDCLELLSIEGCISLTAIPKLRDFKKLRALEIVDSPILPGIEDRKTVKKSALRTLMDFRLEGCPILFESLEGLDSLELLALNKCGKLSKIRGLSGLRKLRGLSVIDYSMLSEIESFEGLESLERLEFIQCKSLEKLPDLSNLRNLKFLVIIGCVNLKEIRGLHRLKSLETLHFTRFKDTEDIFNSRNLKNKLTEIQGLDRLEVESLKVPNFMSTERFLDLSNLKNLKYLSTPECFNLEEIRGLDGLELLERLVLNPCMSMERSLDFSNLKNLKLLHIHMFKNLREIQGFDKLKSLETLYFLECESMQTLPDLSNLRNLKHLSTFGCVNLMEIGDLDGLESLQTLDCTLCLSMKTLPDLSNLRKLKHLSTFGCINLKWIKGLDRLESLETLDFTLCMSINLFLDLSKFRNLKHLDAYLCENLMEIQGINSLGSNLREIQGIDSLESLERLYFLECLSRESLPYLRRISMERLEVLSKLRNLKRLTPYLGSQLRLQGIERFESLEILNFVECVYMERLPSLSVLRNLKHLSTAGCIDLKEIPGLDTLESLETLDLSRCMSLQSLPSLSNLRNLKRLYAYKCNKLTGIWGLDRLESLERLDLTSCTSMERLPNLSNLRNLKHLSTSKCIKLMEIQGLDRLESLEFLDVSGCKFNDTLQLSKSKKLKLQLNIQHLRT